jgi:FMN phosphatase YigB (HAD superfamily)
MQCVIVTTSPRTSVEAILNSTNLIEFFDLLVVGDEVQRGKPDPLPYSTALLKLGIGPGEAVAFEDSLTSLASATGAGIPTVGMLASLDERTALLAGAVRTAKDFLDVGLRPWLITRRTASPLDVARGSPKKGPKTARGRLRPPDARLGPRLPRCGPSGLAG